MKEIDADKLSKEINVVTFQGHIRTPYKYTHIEKLNENHSMKTLNVL